MQDSIRRVNKLRLSAQTEDGLSGDIAALQDAFRIASLPGIPPQGLLLIKKLELGSFRSRSSALTLSQLIDSRIRTEAAAAIRADRGDFDQHDLVWFSDPAAAAVGLADNVAQKRNPHAWYWRSLFPDWREGMSLADTLDAIAAGSHGAIPVAAVLSQVVRHLIRVMPAAGLIDAIKPRLAQSLLCDAGVYPGPSPVATAETATPADSGRPTILPAAWERLIDLAVEQWDANDPRCLWFGYCAVTSCNPALAANPGLIDRIKPLVGRFTAAVDTDSTAATSTQTTARTKPEPGSTADTATVAAAARAFARETDPKPKPDNAAPITTPAVPEPDAQNAPTPRAPITPGRQSRSIDETAPPANRAPDYDASEKRPPGPTSIQPDSNDPNGPRAVAGTLSSAGPVSFDGLVDSDHAGLIFAVSLIGLLAIDRLLARHAVLAEINLPARVIRDIGLRLQIPRDHPLLQALPEPPRPDSGLDSFESPETWRSLIALPGGAPATLHRFDTTRSGSRCYLTDRSRRLLLYAGAADLPRWTRQHRIARHAGVHAAPDPRTLSQGVQLLMNRYLRRYAGIGLRQLVLRPGRFASSRTHLDVLFDIEQTDIRIRKAGLDINPGWVAWLARVVQFHYQDGETADV